MPRDLSTRLFKAGRLSLVFDPRDWRIGLYIGPDAVCLPLLCLSVRWERVPPRVTFTFPHGTQATVDRHGNIVGEEASG